MKKYYLAILSIILIASFLFYFGNSQDKKLTNDELNLLNDYTSKVYQKIKPSDLDISKAQLLDRMNIPDEKRSKFKFEFYKLEYKNLNEIHAKGTSETGNCYNVALVDAENLLDNTINTKGAGMLLFQDMSPVPVRDTHECEGEPCSRCAFTRDENGEINGCMCRSIERGGGQCNHTVTSG